MPALLEDIHRAAHSVAEALCSSGYHADFSIESLREIDRFFDEHTKDGDAVPGGLLGERLGQRMFSLGSYVGEVVRGAYGGEWLCNDNDPEGEINVAVRLSTGSIIWPVQRVMKRFKNGPDDGIYVYGVLVGGRVAPKPRSEIGQERLPIVARKPSRAKKKPWWRFW